MLLFKNNRLLFSYCLIKIVGGEQDCNEGEQIRDRGIHLPGKTLGDQVYHLTCDGC